MTIDSSEAAAHTDDDLERFMISLGRQPVTPSVESLNTTTGVLSASFAVDANTSEAALTLAKQAFVTALAEAGLPGTWAYAEHDLDVPN